MSRRPILSTAHRARAFVLAVLVLAGGLVETIHRAQVSHTVCPEHGELVHGEFSHGEFANAPVSPCGSTCGTDELPSTHSVVAANVAAPRDHIATEASTSTRTSMRIVPSKHSFAHEHCAFVTLLGSSASPWCGAVGGYHVPLGVVVHRAQVPEIPPVAQPPLSFAPKHSPPVCAA